MNDARVVADAVSVEPYKIAVPQILLDDLAARLARTRWTDEVDGAGWDYGTNLQYLQELVRYWQSGYDWRAQERTLNRFLHYRANVRGFGVHFIHQRGVGPKPLPIVLIHGFPDSFARMVKLIPRLTDPAAHGADPADAFEVIVPALPGYAFSDRPSSPGVTSAGIADLFAALLRDGLGFARYGVHGGDWGAAVGEQLGLRHADAVLGLHMTEIPYGRVFSVPPEQLSETEQKYVETGKQWQMSEGAYGLIQATKPQTVAYGLNDSPVGLAAWVIEKFRGWSDCGGDVERCFTKDELLTQVMLFWVSETINSAFRLYYEAQHHPEAQAQGKVEVPTAFAMFPKDLVNAPRDLGERFFNVQRWTEMPKGGHFAALEQPDLLAEDIRTFFRSMRDA